MKYRLKKDLPMLGKGAIFEHKEWTYDKNLGSPLNGYLEYIYINGSCQSTYTEDGKNYNWCGDGKFIFIGDVRHDRNWFEPLEESRKEKLLRQIEELKQELYKL